MKGNPTTMKEFFDSLRDPDRPEWKDYFMFMAFSAALRGTCDRAYVGAVFVREKRVLATGYNSSPIDLPNCADDGHLMVDGHCIRTVHAEQNAIAIAAREGVSLRDSDLYITTFPCYTCFKSVVQVGTQNIYYNNAYRITQQVLDDSKRLNINIEQVTIDHLLQ